MPASFGIPGQAGPLIPGIAGPLGPILLLAAAPVNPLPVNLPSVRKEFPETWIFMGNTM